MTALLRSGSLMRCVRRRLRTVAVSRRAYVVLLALCGAYAAVLLASRLLGVIPDVFVPLTLAAIPAAAALLGLLLHRQPTWEETARRIDRRGGTKDLFLTVALLDGSPGEFQPIVAVQAERKASEIRPEDVVPFRWGRQCVAVLVSLLVLFAGVQFLPQLDPFGKVEAAQQDTQRKKLLDASRKATVERLAQI